MTDARIVKVFLGSSITELKDERVRISDSISQDLTRLFEQDDIIIQFLKCESIHEDNDGTPDQDKIEEMLRKCDVSLFLFKDKEGKYTLHEYETARALQKENKKHKIYVYYLRDWDEKKPEGLTPFQERLIADGVYWKYCDSLSDLKYYFALGLLMNLGVHCGETVRSAGEMKKDGDAIFEQYQQNHQMVQHEMHQEIEKLLAQIDPVMNDPDTPIAARITQVLGLYQKADLWASKTDYDKEKYSHLLYDYAQFLYNYGMYNDAEKVYFRQIPLAEELYGKEHENTAASYNNIGAVYYAQGDYPKALEYYGKALAIVEKVLGKEHPNTAASYDNIGLVYDAQGDYPQALVYYGNSLAIYEKVLGKEHPLTATSYNNIGAVYKAQGDYPQALEYYGKALAIREKVLGKEHPDTAGTYNSIGVVYKNQGDYPKALEYYQKALVIYEKVLGKEHPSTATIYNNIGLVYDAQGDYPQALEYLNKALSIVEKVLGKEHPNTATSYSNIGGVYDAQGDYPQALECYLKSLAIYEKVLGKEHPSTATSYNNIGGVYYQWGKYLEASEYLEKALKIFKAKLGDSHPMSKTVEEWVDATNAAIKKENKSEAINNNGYKRLISSVFRGKIKGQN